jgi:hypothetical protein
MSKSAYYKNAVRFSRDGIPCKVASWVKDLSDRSRAELMRGTDGEGTSQKSRQAGAAMRHYKTTYFGTDGEPMFPVLAMAAE